MRTSGWTGLVGLVVATLAGCASDVEVEGIVRDAQTRQPIEGAMVRIDGDAVRTDHEGYYEIDDVDGDKRVSVYVSAPGYEPINDSRRLGDDEALIDFDLSPGGEYYSPNNRRLKIQMRQGERPGMPEIDVEAEEPKHLQPQED